LSTIPEEILRSPETKLLLVRFERSVSADQARKAWNDGLVNNCKSPCQLDPKDVEQFLADIPAMHTGDNFSLLFNQHSATVTVGRQQIGTISSPQFTDVGDVPWPQSSVPTAQAGIVGASWMIPAQW
jgi:hypothetical protein